MDATQHEDPCTDPAIDSLSLIADSIEQSLGSLTGQTEVLVRFLAGLYNGSFNPFNLTELRRLDGELKDACLHVLKADMAGTVEIHQWGVVSREELIHWFEVAGLFQASQERDLGRQLYRNKYGEAGHPKQLMPDWRLSLR